MRTFATINDLYIIYLFKLSVIDWLSVKYAITCYIVFFTIYYYREAKYSQKYHIDGTFGVVSRPTFSLSVEFTLIRNENGI